MTADDFTDEDFAVFDALDDRGATWRKRCPGVRPSGVGALGRRGLPVDDEAMEAAVIGVYPSERKAQARLRRELGLSQKELSAALSDGTIVVVRQDDGTALAVVSP